jgi:hypothetical protein
MAPLLFHHYAIVSAGAGTETIRINNLGHVILRFISMRNETDVCIVTCGIVLKNTPNNSPETGIIVPRIDTVAPSYAVTWEGELELGEDQDLLLHFEDAVGVGPTAGDSLEGFISYERV